MEIISGLFNWAIGLFNGAIDHLDGAINWAMPFLPSGLGMIPAYLIGWYLVSKVYASIFNVAPKNVFNAKDIISAQKTQTGWGMLLSPIAAVLAFLYNFGNQIVWLIGELLGWIVKGLMWVYNQVIVAGLFLLLRVLWHYLIVWPWNLLKLAFSQIMPSLDKALFIMALKGLFIAFVIAFIGRYLTLHFQTSAMLENFFILISLLPIGWTAGQIAIATSKSKMDGKEFRQRYIRHAIFVIGFGLVVAAAMWLLINLGSRSSFAYSLSSLFIGGSLIGSAFLILAALMFVFILSALPSFSRDYKGDYKGFPAAFGSHIYNKGARYLLALPAMLVPAILLTVIPYYLSKGFSYTSSKVTNDVYNERIKNVNEAIEKASIPAYDAWEDFRSVNEDSLKKLIAADQKLLELKSQSEVLQTNMQFLQDFYGSNYDSLAAAPIGAAYYFFDSYNQQQRDRINVRSYEKIAIDSQAFADEISSSDQSAKNAKENVDNKQKEIEALNASLAKVCDTGSNNSNNDQIQPPPDNNTPAATEEVDTRDACQKQRDAINASIAGATKEKASLDSQLTRTNMVNAHIVSMRSKLNSMQSNRNFSSLLGHLLATLWYSLLMAFAFALALVLFARVNDEIYLQKDKNDNWMVMDELNNARNANPNQPLLGLGILAIIGLAYLGSASCWNPMNWDLGLYQPAPGECCVQTDTCGVQDSTGTTLPMPTNEPSTEEAPATEPAVEPTPAMEDPYDTETE